MQKPFTYFLPLLIILFLCGRTSAQDSVYEKTSFQKGNYEKGKNKKFNSSRDGGGKYYQSKKGEDESSIAKNYEDKAKEFSDKGEYSKAEEHLKKALIIYGQLKMKEDKARVARNLAKAQEQQGKNDEAVKNYDLAKEESFDKEQITINGNDASRLRNSSNLTIQNNYSNANAEIFKKQGNKDELKDAYLQQAKTNSIQNNTSGALENYGNALNTVDNSTEQMKIKDEMANIYTNTNQTNKAKEIRSEIISQAQQVQDANTEIKQKQSLANILFKEKNNPEAVRLLQESYDKALESHNTMEAKKSIELLIKYYRDNGNYEKSIQLYDQFLKKLEQLVKSDSSLTDPQLLEATAEKIKQLENEKGLQDEIIGQKNTFNYVLVGAIILIIVFLLFLTKAFYSVKNKNKEIALQSLRREMNPHFIFNSLNSVNQFIAENKELEANKYLTSYSNLMRTIMENSNKDFISISNEIELIKKYLDLEHLRFKEKFDYKIIVDEKLDVDTALMPNMIIQPQLENAIWHGLRYKNEKGLLEVKFSLEDHTVRIEIHDDGIGLTRSKELKTLNQKNHTSRGLNNTMERIKLINELYQKNIELTISEKTKNRVEGTLVEITFPVINKI